MLIVIDVLRYQFGFPESVFPPDFGTAPPGYLIRVVDAKLMCLQYFACTFQQMSGAMLSFRDSTSDLSIEDLLGRARKFDGEEMNSGAIYAQVAILGADLPSRVYGTPRYIPAGLWPYGLPSYQRALIHERNAVHWSVLRSRKESRNRSPPHHPLPVFFGSKWLFVSGKLHAREERRSHIRRVQSLDPATTLPRENVS